MLHQLIDDGFAEPLDVHRAARREVLDPPPHLRRALAVHATDRHLPFVLHDGAAAFRTMLRHPEFFLGALSQIRADAHHGRNYFAGFLDQDGVADSNIFPRDLFFVVQGGAADGAAADHDWLERRHGRQRSGASDLNENIEQAGFDALGLVFEGDRPTRRFRGEAEYLAL